MANIFDTNSFNLSPGSPGTSTTPATPKVPFASTDLGIAANTLNPISLVKAASKVGLSMIQSGASAAAAIPASIVQLFNPKASSAPVSPFMQRLLGEPTQQSFQEMSGHAAAGESYGTENLVGALAAPVIHRLQSSPTAQKYGLDKLAPFLAVGSVLGDSALSLGGFGDLSGDAELVSQLVKESNPEAVGGILRQNGIAPHVADKFAPAIADTKNPAAVKDALGIATAVQHTQDTTDALHPGVLQDVQAESHNPQAAADWEQNYAGQHQTIGERAAQLRQEAAQSPEAGSALAPKIADLNEQQRALEEDFVNKWRQPPAEATPGTPTAQTAEPRTIYISRTPATPEAAASEYYDKVIAPEMARGGPTVIGADNMKDYYGGDYNDANHPTYSKASFQLYERALKENPDPTVVLTGGGPASGKTEILVNDLRAKGFPGIIYDSNLSNYEGAVRQIKLAEDAGKQVEIRGVLPNLDSAHFFSFIRGSQTGRNVSAKTFARGHAGFPAVVQKLLQNGIISPEQVKILDFSRPGRTTLEQTRAAADAGGFHKDPLALLAGKQYNEEALRQKYGARQYGQFAGKDQPADSGRAGQEPGAVGGGSQAHAENGADGNAAGAQEQDARGGGPVSPGVLHEALIEPEKPMPGQAAANAVPAEEGAPRSGAAPLPKEYLPTEEQSLDLAAKQDQGSFALRDTAGAAAVRDLEQIFAEMKGVEAKDLSTSFSAEDLANAKTELQIGEETLLDHPGRALMKYVSRETGDLPELGAKTTANRNISTSKFAKEGDTIFQNLIGQEASKGGDVVHAQELVDDYRALKSRVDAVRENLKNVRDSIRLQKEKGAFVRDAQRVVAREVAKDTTALRNLLKSAERAGARKGSAKAEQFIGEAIDRLKGRRGQIENLQKEFALSDRQFSKILGRRDPRFMTRDEYATFYEGLKDRAARARSALDKYGPLKSPIEDLAHAGDNGGDKSWRSLIKDWYENSGKKTKVGMTDYLTTPEYVLDRLGLGDVSEAVHDAHDTYLKQRDIEIGKIQDWKNRVGTDRPYSSERIFRWLDGREREVYHEMTPVEREVAGEIRGYLKSWADRLNLPEDNRIAKYITHLFEPGQAAEAQGESIFDDPELAAIMGKKVAGSVYDPFLEQRLGKQGYKEDVWGALDAYVKRATRKEAIDPVLERMVERAKGMDQSVYNYVARFSHNVNMRPTETEKLLDNSIKALTSRFGDRPTAYISNKIRGGFYRGTIGLNFGSALRNLSQGANTYAKLGERYTLTGYAKIAWKMAKGDLGELHSSGVMGDQYIQDKKVGIYKTLLQKVDPVLYGLFEKAEQINRGAAFYGAKAKALGQGLDEEQAIKYAKRIVRETQFAFSSVDTPVGLSDNISKTFSQLQTYNIKQIEFLGRMVRNKEFAGLVRWTVATLAFVDTVGKIFGMNLGQVLPSVSLTGSPFASSITAAYDYALGANTPQEKAKAASQVRNVILSRIPAGVQAYKTLTGLETVNQGYGTSASGKTIEYRVPQTPERFIQAGLFGKSVLPEAQAYYKKISNPKASSVGGNPFNR